MPNTAPVPPAARRPLARRRTYLRLRGLLIQILGWLRLRRFLKRAYCRILGPGGGILPVEYAGQTARFYVHSQANAQDLSQVQDERSMLTPMMGALRPGDCAFDIGAEVGLYSLFLAPLVGHTGHIVAFEPSGEAFERLLDNVRLNRARNIRPLRLALSDREGALNLYREGTGYAPTLRDPAAILQNHTVVEKVRVARGDALRPELRLPLPRALKIDVEGAEFSVLQGLRETLSHPECVLVCCEIHPRILPAGVTPETIVAWVRELGFSELELKPRDHATTHLIAHKPRQLESMPVIA
ncbi:MAG: FkbM family methyltransferase [Streptosporangiaceae bacterium]